MSIKIFSMNDYEWMAATDLDSAKAKYLALYAGGVSEEESINNPGEISDEDLDQFVFVEDDDTRLSFRAKLEQMVARGVSFPAYFASTEY